MELTEQERRMLYQGMKFDQDLTPPATYRPARSRVMYIEDKSGGLEGPARIGRVYFSKTGKPCTTGA